MELRDQILEGLRKMRTIDSFDGLFRIAPPSKFNLILERENTTKMKFALEGGDQKNRLNIVSLNAHFRFQSMVKINGLARDVNSIRKEEKSSFL